MKKSNNKTQNYRWILQGTKASLCMAVILLFSLNSSACSDLPACLGDETLNADNGCKPFGYTCENGTPADAPETFTKEDVVNKCASCDEGYQFSAGTCLPSYVCENGTPASGATAETHGDIKCASCDSGNSLITEGCFTDNAFSLHHNGVTIVCPGVADGGTGTVGDSTYTKRNTTDSDTNEITTGNADESCTSGVTSMLELFKDETSFNENISHWDTSKVTTMNTMFYKATAFNQDISSWNTSNVIDMTIMFAQVGAFNQDISGWNTENVTNMISMFFYAMPSTKISVAGIQKRSQI